MGNSKKLTLVLIIFVSSAFSIFAQDDDLDMLPFDEEPLREQSKPYFVIGGGFTITGFINNVDEINNAFNAEGVASQFGFAKLQTPLVMYGGHGFTGIPWVANLRLGFQGLGGSTSQNVSDYQLEVDNQTISVNQSLDYTVGYVGLSLGYGFVLFDGFAVIPEFTLGMGDLSLEFAQTHNDPDFTNQFIGNSQYNMMRRIESSFFNLSSALNIEYAVTPFLAFRVAANYNQSFAYNWQLNGVSEINNVPDGINANGFGIQVGVMLGLFNY